MSDDGKAEGETKPEGGSEPITIRVRDQTGEETYFKIKKTTKMQKVFDTYASRKGVQASSLRFLLDGERIQPDATPKQLELDDQDQIDCMLEQSGGSFWRKNISLIATGVRTKDYCTISFGILEWNHSFPRCFTLVEEADINYCQSTSRSLS